MMGKVKKSTKGHPEMAIAGSYHCLRLEVHREETGSQGPVPRSPEENWATVGDPGS